VSQVIVVEVAAGEDRVDEGEAGGGASAILPPATRQPTPKTFTADYADYRSNSPSGHDFERLAGSAAVRCFQY